MKNSHLLIPIMGQNTPRIRTKHKKWKETDGAYLQVIKEKLLEGFRDAEDFGYMKGYEPWEKLIYK